jgi:hypothetical protein
MADDKKDNTCSNSTGKRMARGAAMAVNPAGALIMRAIMSSKARNENNNASSTTNDGCY